MPETGISPDADFPVIYAEKGIVHLTFEFDCENPSFTSLSGGKSANMVCDYCQASAPENKALLEQLGLEYVHSSPSSSGPNAAPHLSARA